MKTIHTKDAAGATLDWLVAKCEGRNPNTEARRGYVGYPGFAEANGFGHAIKNYSTDWSHGGPIIARRQIGLDQFKGQPCRAYLGTPARYEHAMFAPEGHPLVAAMRCYVASKLGDTAEVPDELAA